MVGQPPKQKCVRIMCDYAADGMWHCGGGEFVSDDAPPISGRAQLLMYAWQAAFELGYGHPLSHLVDDKVHWGFGLFIARLVKFELPDWTVFYYDDEVILRPEDLAPTER